jgi:hypothetical protein
VGKLTLEKEFLKKAYQHKLSQQTSFTIVGSSNNTDTSRTIPLIGFILCAIGMVVVLALLIIRQRAI